MFSAQEDWRCQQPQCRMRSFLSPSTASVCARRSLRALWNFSSGTGVCISSPGNARSSENVHRTKAFVKCELLAAQQNTLRNMVCGLGQIEFYWLWGPRRLRNWFYEISVKLCHWFLAWLWDKNTLLTTKHANPSSHPGSKPQPVQPSGFWWKAPIFRILLFSSKQFDSKQFVFQKTTNKQNPPKQINKTLKYILRYFMFSALQSRTAVTETSILHRTEIHRAVRFFLYKFSLPTCQAQRLFYLKQLLEQYRYASA